MPQQYSKTDNERLLLVETLTESNAKAIDKIAKLLEQLTNTVAKEDSRIKDLISQLVTDRDLCRQRQEYFMERLEAKQQSLIDLKNEIQLKANEAEVQAIRRALFRIMWGVFGGMGTILLTLIVLYIKKGALGG